MTPLMQAVMEKGSTQNNVMDCVQRLIEVGKALPNITDKTGQNAMFYWARGNKTPEIGYYLVEKAGVNPLQPCTVDSQVSVADIVRLVPHNAHLKGTPRFGTAIAVAMGIGIPDEVVNKLESLWLNRSGKKDEKCSFS
jgi:hypothetical protein